MMHDGKIEDNKGRIAVEGGNEEYLKRQNKNFGSLFSMKIP